MSSFTLKEQLQALSMTPPATSLPASSSPSHKYNKKGKINAGKTQSVKQKPLWLEHAQYGVELLKAYFPACFKEVKETQPLKVGIKQDLVKRLGSIEGIVLGDKACMVNSLAYYVNSVAYHKSMVVGAARCDLDGNPSGVVTAEEAQYSLDCRKAKMEKNKSAPMTSKNKGELGSE